MEAFDLPFPMRFFDPSAEVRVDLRCLPHWSQAGAVSFITWRAEDSMPAPALDAWHEERWNWLQRRGIDPARPDWKERLSKQGSALLAEFNETFWNRWHDALDSGHGACLLRRPDLSEIVRRSLLHFDQQRYLMLDFVVMPNHVHLLAAFPDDDAMLRQCENWAAELHRGEPREGAAAGEPASARRPTGRRVGRQAAARDTSRRSVMTT